MMKASRQTGVYKGTIKHAKDSRRQTVVLTHAQIERPLKAMIPKLLLLSPYLTDHTNNNFADTK